MMKKLVSACALGMLLCAASAQAADRPLLASLFSPRLVSQQYEPMTVPPAPGTSLEPVPVAGEPVELYHCVRYKDLRNIHPCAVPMIVQVKDPCACRNPCSCCAPACVNVQICVPNCGCPRISSNRDGSKVKYDYGDYEVEITSRRGVVTVDYDD